jgi:3-deoxy-7-phosphoheptulonate synthase
MTYPTPTSPTFSSVSDTQPAANDNVRITGMSELSPPSHLMREFPSTTKATLTTAAARQATHNILHGQDDRLLVVVGPCSIHDTAAAMEYCSKLLAERSRLSAELEIVMRVYFEKPRTTVGWKGLINDPDLNNTYQINKGLRVARELLLNINDAGMPAATEFLDVISPQYVADLIAWGAIGARTTESQVHRELASGLSCPVGFKNGTDGNIKIASDAIKSASHPHHFLSVTKGGYSAIFQTKGNDDCHVILRGGKTPNYAAEHIQATADELSKAGLAAKIMVDCSHANSSKKHENQITVAADIAEQVSAGDARIMGVMVESHLRAGNQSLVPGQTLADLNYGQSITDACIDWADTVALLNTLADAVKARRAVQAG